MNNRPYFRSKAGELETMIESNKNSLEVLKEIHLELSFRSTAKAEHLRLKVEVILKSSNSSIASEPPKIENQKPESSSLQEQVTEVFDFPDIPQMKGLLSKKEMTPIHSESLRRSSILKYWRAVEIFNPQTVPKEEGRGSEPVYSIVPANSSPWEVGHSHRRRVPKDDCQWRYLLYVGVYPTALLSEALEEVFGKDPEALDERVDGDAATFSISLNHRGEVLLDTFVLSSAAWALGRLVSPGYKDPDWLNGFEETEKHLQEYVSTIFSVDQPKESETEKIKNPLGRVVTGREIFLLLDKILKFLNLGSVGIQSQFSVKCVSVYYTKTTKTDDSDVLNSFFIRDLKKVSERVSQGIESDPLRKYLNSLEPASHSSRADMRQVDPLGLCWSKLQPSRYPSAKWPSPGHYPLVYSQQIAVNELSKELTHQGLFGVNGPPGTGKTTLLRDVIASLVTQRAEVLSGLKNPAAGFEGHSNWKSGTYQKRINHLAKSLSGFEIVVASSNNGAVENITLELPTLSAIDPEWKNEVDYFSDFASRLIETEAWGLIAARLGNKGNRKEFVSKFWYGEDLDGQNQPKKRDGFKDYLEEMEAQPCDWNGAVLKFKQALREERSIRETREDIYQEVLRLQKFTKELEVLSHQVKDLEIRAGERDQAQQKSASDLQLKEVSLSYSKKTRVEHHQFKPVWWMVILTLGKVYREWSAEDLKFKKTVKAAQSDYDIAFKQSQKDIQEYAQALQNLEAGRQNHDKISEALKKSEQKIEQARNQWGDFFPATPRWNEDEDLREKSSPWMERVWSLAREKVFISALRLHREFIHSNAKLFRQNLSALDDVLSGNLPANASPESIQFAWSTLFMVIPVVSTTFASFDRLFPYHGAENIGWLFIDEAGQATPQAAAGALWRSKRALVVGDPLQLEPILSLPFTAQDSLRKHYGVDPRWRPGELSCQRLADQATLIGTWIPTEGGPLWVGSPLRVHRRCDNPMFSISNQVAYGGMMVYGTLPRNDVPYVASHWFDVVSENADSHWISEEGEVVQGILKTLFAQGAKPEEICLISPFRAVVRELRKIAQPHREMMAGTIHTVQGKEREIVILVLGGNPQKPGAKDWAAKKPNLLNVAVSRAKRRIYVVGNRREWSKRPYFDVMSKSLK